MLLSAVSGNRGGNSGNTHKKKQKGAHKLS